MECNKDLAEVKEQLTNGDVSAQNIVREVPGKTTQSFFAFVDLEKAHDRVPRDVVYWCLRNRGVQDLESLIR